MDEEYVRAVLETFVRFLREGAGFIGANAW